MSKRKGRPPIYDPDKFPAIAEQVCSMFGAIDTELAIVFGVTVNAINKWKQEHESFLQAIKKGKDSYDTNEVEVSLKKRAVGFENTEEHIEFKTEKGKKKKRIRNKYIKDSNKRKRKSDNKTIQDIETPDQKIKRITKYYVPNVTAAIFWLVNRNRNRWKNLKSVDIKKDTTHTSKFEIESKKSEDMWRTIIKELGPEKAKEIRASLANAINKQEDIEPTSKDGLKVVNGGKK